MLTIPGHDVVGLLAANPGPFTLSGTNTWVVGRDPAYVVDPGPALDAHIDAVLEELARRGGLGGIALTHDHADHTGAVPARRQRAARDGGARPPLAGSRGEVDVTLSDGDRFGPLTALATPGHAPDHLAFLAGAVAFTGDAVLGEGSVFVTGQLAGYLDSLRALRARAPEALCPGHGPPVSDPARKLDEYVAHRLERERRLLAALADGVRGQAALLDVVWDDAPAQLRAAAAITLNAHLEKLARERRLPPDLAR